MPFHCSIVTPEAAAFDADVTQAIVPAHDGQLGILANHAPILVKLGIGPLQLDIPGKPSEKFFIDGGVAQMANNKLTLLTQVAQPAGAIDRAKAQSDLTAAEALADGDKNKHAAVRRAQARLALATK